jgi:hypothetical protein
MKKLSHRISFYPLIYATIFCNQKILKHELISKYQGTQNEKAGKSGVPQAGVSKSH